METQLQVEARAKQNLEETNKELQLENSNIYLQNKERIYYKNWVKPKLGKAAFM